MKQKYKNFVVSDIHSFYTPLITALKEAGYDKDNPDHRLIVCGDIFDRGDESLEVYNFLRSIPKERRVLIRGNHEYLFKSCVRKFLPAPHDFTNGTVNSVCTLAQNEKEAENFYNVACTDPYNIEKQEEIWKKLTSNPIFKEIIDWIFNSGEWVDYYEYKEYIFVHSFIPLGINKKMGGYTYYYKPNWRECATPEEFEVAAWGCPYKLFDEGYFKEEAAKGKILVCGHWHCSDFHYHYEGTENQFSDFSIYKGKNLIAIDKCTAKTNQVNVLVIE